MASLYSSFFIPQILIARDNPEEELAFSEPVDEETENSNVLLVIDYDGLLIPLPDGTFLIPPYQVFSIQLFELKNNVIHMHLSCKEHIRGEAMSISDRLIEWIEKKGPLPRSNQIDGKRLQYFLREMHASYAHLVR